MKAFRKHIVSIACVTPSASLDQLSKTIGAEPSSSSHDRGTPRPAGDVWDVTVWKFESSLPSTASLEEHVDDVFKRLSLASIKRAVQLIGDMKVYLDVAVITDMAACSACFSVATIDTLQRLGASAEITFYSSAECDPDRESGVFAEKQ
jgi:Domain of unknown function (DUF4279)